MALALALALRRRGDHCLVTVAGELDTANAKAFGAFLRAEFDDCGHDLVVDLRRLDFLDAAGIGVLVAAAQQLQAAGGVLSVVCDQPKILRLFALTGTAEQLRVHVPTAS